MDYVADPEIKIGTGRIKRQRGLWFYGLRKMKVETGCKQMEESS